MPEPEVPSYVLTVEILLSVCLGMLLWLLIMSFRISGRLRRIEKSASLGNGDAHVMESEIYLAETSPGGAFEAFLSEEPERREMTKGEQFAAYRQWRREKGMNWSNS
ncbi:MAG: hypothetical protein ABI600_11930 [Luteolibacter sp.]